MLQELLQGLIAQSADGAPEGPGFPQMLILFGGFFLIFYFLILRPQAKQQKEQESFRSGLKKGDEVVLTSGIFGRLLEVREADVTVEIAPGVKVRVLKTSIATGVTTQKAGDGKAEAEKKS